MIRKIIQIDESRCNGCGLCAKACHEGAIAIVDGKARLIRDDFCDGFGDCLPNCPTGAISFTEREAAAYDEQAVQENKKRKQLEANAAAAACPGRKQPSGPKMAGCPGHQVRQLHPAGHVAGAGMCPGHQVRQLHTAGDTKGAGMCPGQKMRQLQPAMQEEEFPLAPVQTSQLAQWPCQIRLVPVNAPYFNGAKLLVAADCTAYAYANMHRDFMRGKITLIGCPKLDAIDYSEKLTQIIKNNNIKSVTVVRMEVPCCGGLERAVIQALKNSGKFLPWQIVTISIEGEILD